MKNRFIFFFIFVFGFSCQINLWAANESSISDQENYKDLSPRLIITIDPESSISIQDLTKILDAHVVYGSNDKALEVQINSLDKSSKNHRIVLGSPVEDLEKLADDVGYEFLILKENDISTACDAIAAKEKEIPLTDAFFPRIDPQTAGLLYDLMIKVDRILKEHKLPYWATGGTLIGAVRHKGLIPWDDDLDICMYEHDIPKLLSLKQVLKEHGLVITDIVGRDYYNISFIKGEKIEITDENKNIKRLQGRKYFDYTFPYLDIFPVSLQDGDKLGMVYANKRLISEWPNDYFLPHELTFTLLPFGPLSISVPYNAKEILKRMYTDFGKVAIRMGDHRRAECLKKIKVAYVDRSVTPYVLPVEQDKA